VADKVGLARISTMFRDLYGKPIAESAYRWWLRIFHDVSNKDLEAAAMWLIEQRERSSMVTPGEMTWALKNIGVYVKHEEDPAFAKAMAQQFPAAEGKGITLAEFCKTYPEAGQALRSYIGGER